jgi:hypothetical protein
MAVRNRNVFRIEGVERIRRTLSELSRAAQMGGKEAVDDLARQVMEGSIARAPKLSGDLEESHHITTTGTFMTGTYRVQVNVGPVYGADGTDYSLLMHEGIIAGVPYHLGPVSEAKNHGVPHVGDGVGMKFLERSFNAVYRESLRDIARRVKDALENVAP